MEKPASNTEAKRTELERKIAEKRKLVEKLPQLEADYPELVARPNDTGLPGPQYRIWQEIRALRLAKELLEEYEKELSDLD